MYSTGFKFVAVGTICMFRGALFVDAMDHPALPAGVNAPTWGIVAGSTVTLVSLNFPMTPPNAIPQNS